MQSTEVMVGARQLERMMLASATGVLPFPEMIPCNPRRTTESMWACVEFERAPERLMAAPWVILKSWDRGLESAVACINPPKAYG